MRYKAIWPTLPREFVVFTTWIKEDNGSILVTTKSVADEAFPCKLEYVRGKVIISGFKIVPKNEGGCDLSLLAHTDLGGSVPAWFTNSLSASAPFKILTAISNLLGSANLLS
jgi:hypothetical protein